jgi:hypothetical protein
MRAKVLCVESTPRKMLSETALLSTRSSAMSA